MARSTGIILATGGVTLLNQSVLNGKPVDWRVPVATGFAAAAFALLEKANEQLVVGVAWIALLTVLLARVDPKVPAPTETLLRVWKQGG
jgi:hypothetical protein